MELEKLSYMARITKLSKKLLREVEGICRAFFFWKGLSEFGGPGLVAWEKVCTGKKYR